VTIYTGSITVSGPVPTGVKGSLGCLAQGICGYTVMLHQVYGSEVMLVTDTPPYIGPVLSMMDEPVTLQTFGDEVYLYSDGGMAIISVAILPLPGSTMIGDASVPFPSLVAAAATGPGAALDYGGVATGYGMVAVGSADLDAGPWTAVLEVSWDGATWFPADPADAPVTVAAGVPSGNWVDTGGLSVTSTAVPVVYAGPVMARYVRANLTAAGAAGSVTAWVAALER